MQRNKRISLIFLGAFGMFMSAASYWFYFSGSASFPAERQLIDHINTYFPESSVDQIQETVNVDERHVFVPFITKDQKYGGSNWEWKKHQWECTAIETKGNPYIWKIDENDPASFYLVWNGNPSHELGYMKLFMKRKAGYSVSDGKENYIPNIQMEAGINIREKSFGVQKLPASWAHTLTSHIKMGSAAQPFSLFKDNGFQQFQFGWLPFSSMEGELISPENMDLTGFSRQGEDTETFLLLNQMEVFTESSH
ncbi:hypothetical protein [Peribacillus sp. SCS-155]|uniref:hypothetical protein n=1 Tax=Peribacillus sedimenti TaxID=3115297 RepID=UPI003906A169